MEFALFAKVFEQGLKLWNSKESTKYLDKLLQLKKEWKDAYDNPQRDHNTLDDVEFELRILSESFVQAAGVTDAVD